MDATIVAAVIGAGATILGAAATIVGAVIQARRRRFKRDEEEEAARLDARDSDSDPEDAVELEPNSVSHGGADPDPVVPEAKSPLPSGLVWNSSESLAVDHSGSTDEQETRLGEDPKEHGDDPSSLELPRLQLSSKYLGLSADDLDSVFVLNIEATASGDDEVEFNDQSNGREDDENDGARSG